MEENILLYHTELFALGLRFPLERKIFLRERKAGLYPTSAFYVARVTADVPAHIISAILM